jgi:hypothetical protein
MDKLKHVFAKGNMIITDLGPIYLPFTTIWKSKEGHFPVEVTAYLGEMNKRHYVSIKDSTTGVPLDEILI